MTSEFSPTAINPALSFGLNFDSHDLQSNQEGRITSRQVRLLRDKRRQQVASNTLLSRIQGSLFYLLYGVTPRKHLWNLIGADITATIAYEKQGQVNLTQSLSAKDKGQPDKIYQIAVARQQVHVDRRALRSFRHQEPYIVYYAPRSKLALSAESG